MGFGARILGGLRRRGERKRDAAPRPGNVAALIIDLGRGVEAAIGPRGGALDDADGAPVIQRITRSAACLAHEFHYLVPEEEDERAWAAAIGPPIQKDGRPWFHGFAGHAPGLDDLAKVAESIRAPFILLLSAHDDAVTPDVILTVSERLSRHDCAAFHVDGYWVPLPGLWRTGPLAARAAAEAVAGRTGLDRLYDAGDTRPLGEEVVGTLSGWRPTRG